MPAPPGNPIPPDAELITHGRKLLELARRGVWRVAGYRLPELLGRLMDDADVPAEHRPALRAALDRPGDADWDFWAGRHAGTFEGHPDDHVWHPAADGRQEVTFPDKAGLNLTAAGLTLGFVPKDSTNDLGLPAGLHVGLPATLSPETQAILWLLPAEAFLEFMHRPDDRLAHRTAHGLWQGGTGVGRWAVEAMPAR